MYICVRAFFWKLEFDVGHLPLSLSTHLKKLYLCVCMRAYVRILVCTIALVWKSEGSLEKSDLSFYPAGFGVLIQVVRLH